MSKILIFKNDRAGDLMTSLKLISSLNKKDNKLKIYLSDLNIGFAFFFQNIIIEKINRRLKLIEKIKIIIDIFKNKYDEIYILTSNNFYFILPLIFRKCKFYSIVYNNKRNRPNNFLRNYLFKYKIVYRNKINERSYRENQIELLNNASEIDHYFKHIYIPKISTKLKNILPEKFIYFQFRYLFFEQLGWGREEFERLMLELLKKHNFILFSSDFEDNNEIRKYNNYFEENYSIINTKKLIKTENHKNENIFYLKDIDLLNLFFITNESEINVAKHGIISHLSFFHQKKCLSLFNFKIKSLKDFHDQKISYSEWYKNMNFKFSFIDKNIEKATNKIMKKI